MISDGYGVQQSPVISNGYGVPQSPVISDGYVPQSPVISNEYGVPQSSVLSDGYGMPQSPVISDGYEPQIPPCACEETENAPDFSPLEPIQPDPAPAPVEECQFHFSSPEFTITSQLYERSRDCDFVIMVTEGVCSIQLEMTRFSLKKSDRCLDEYLEISGKKYCGDLTGQSCKFYIFKTLIIDVQSFISSHTGCR